ncbi:aquaporin, partial [[Eubacterium] siraeum]|nr:aquaporin [[Eubacterium] siraeum]
MKKFVAELIGTFMLVFVGTGAVVFGNGLDGLGHLGIAFAFGLAIVVAAYSIGTISGAHLNPAVSIAMFINKRLSSSELVNYILGQVVGAFLASAAVFFLLANSGMSTASLGENALA